LDIQESTGFTPPALLDRPVLEGQLAVGYAVFCDVARGRKYSQGYPLRLGPREILDYLALSNAHPSEFHAIQDLVIRIDDAWMSSQVEAREAEKNQKSVAAH